MTRSAASDDICRASVRASLSSGSPIASTKAASDSDASSRNSSSSAPSATPIRAQVHRMRGSDRRFAEPGEHDLVEDRPPPRRAQADRRMDERRQPVGQLLGRPRLLEGPLEDHAPDALLARRASSQVPTGRPARSG